MKPYTTLLEEVRTTQPGWEDLQAPIDKPGSYFFMIQNSREPVTESEEMAPLWKILHLVGTDWTYSCTGWGGENYCSRLSIKLGKTLEHIFFRVTTMLTLPPFLS